MAQLEARYYLYWDHENCPTPQQSSISDIISILKEKISQSLSIQSLHFHSIKFYNNNGKNRLSKKIRNQLNQLSYINCPTVNDTKPESVDKKIIADIGYDLWECKGSYNMVIILISGDSDYSWLLSKIKNNINMATTILIPRFNSKKCVQQTLISCCDKVIDDESLYTNKNKYALTKCKAGLNPPATHLQNCEYYHSNCNIQKKVDNQKASKKKQKKKAPTYKQLLDERLNASQESIDYLTKQARIDLNHNQSLAKGDCRYIVQHFSDIKNSERLPLIRLIDSICRSVGGVFIELFAEEILNMITILYKATDECEKDKLRNILQVWIQTKTFDQNILNQISTVFSVKAIVLCPKCDKQYKAKNHWYKKHVAECKLPMN